MDSDEIIRQFNSIEGKVEKLIEVCKSLEAANSNLKSQIGRLEKELQGKLEAENHYAKNKALVQTKIDNLVAVIDSFVETEAY